MHFSKHYSICAAGFAGVIIVSDDILIYEETLEERDARVRGFLTRIDSNSINVDS